MPVSSQTELFYDGIKQSSFMLISSQTELVIPISSQTELVYADIISELIYADIISNRVCSC